jgi:aspartate aminotransferase-like enzyme
LDVRRLDVPWGEPVLPSALRGSLERNPEVKAVMLVHNETSTGVTNPLADLAGTIRDQGALVIVDAVSAVGALPLEVDGWGIDFVLSGSQKAWMCPPGLLIVAVGPRAWTAYERATYPRFFWDIGEVKKMADAGMTPTTPPLSMIYAFHAALGMIVTEGVVNVWERHRQLGAMTRDGLRAAGLRLLAQEDYASNSVTAFFPPSGVGSKQMLTMLREDYGLEAQGGQAHLAESIIRLGHMGWVHEPEMQQALVAIAAAAARLASAPAEGPLVTTAPTETVRT